MVTTTEAQVEATFEELADKRPVAKVIKDFMRKQPLGTAGMAIVFVMIFATIFAPWIAP